MLPGSEVHTFNQRYRWDITLQRTSSSSHYFWCLRRIPAHRHEPQLLGCVPGRGQTNETAKRSKSHLSSLTSSKEFAMAFDDVGVLREWITKWIRVWVEKQGEETLVRWERSATVKTHSQLSAVPSCLPAISHNQTIQDVKPSAGS